MSSMTLQSSRKRAVNLTLDVDVVEQARHMSHNLSATVESLLVAYIDEQRQEQQSRRQSAHQTALAWNDVNAAVGSFSDEYATL